MKFRKLLCLIYILVENFTRGHRSFIFQSRSVGKILQRLNRFSILPRPSFKREDAILFMWPNISWLCTPIYIYIGAQQFNSSYIASKIEWIAGGINIRTWFFDFARTTVIVSVIKSIVLIYFGISLVLFMWLILRAYKECDKFLQNFFELTGEKQWWAWCCNFWTIEGVT